MTTDTLQYRTLVLDGAARAAGTLPTGEGFVTSPLTITLLTCGDEGVLIDAPYTHGQVDRTRAWLRKAGVRLKFVYITHGHGDHWFGVDSLLGPGTDVDVYAMPAAIDKMRVEATQGRAQMWDVALPDLIPPSPVTARSVPSSGLDLGHHPLIPVDLGHTDTDGTSGLWVPDLGLFVAGDAIYNGAHQMMVETVGGGMQAWLDAIDIVESYNPRAVVAGHKAPGLPDDPRCIAETREYLLAARELLETCSGERQFYDSMLERYPERLNPAPLWYSAQSLFAG